MDGERIYGLNRRPNQGRFYASEDPNVTFGRKPIEAVIRFAQWRFKTGRSELNPAEVIRATKKKAPCKRRKIALEAVQQMSLSMSLSEIANLLGLQPSRLRQAVIEQAEDDPSSTAKMPVALRNVLERHARGSEQGYGAVFLPDNFQFGREMRRREWDEAGDRPRS